jgi:hypothetical protein
MSDERHTDRPGRPFGAEPTAEHPFVVEVRTVGDPKYYRNGLSFETARDADTWGFDLLLRWFGAEDYRVMDTRTGDIVRDAGAVFGPDAED